MSENPAQQSDYFVYLTDQVLSPFYANRLAKLQALKLRDILRRKNPYLFKAKNIDLAGDLVKAITDAYLSSQEETLFGGLLENFAIYIASVKWAGFKSKLKSVDLEFRRDDTYYIVGIKSGVYWGNADQINAMKRNFKAAKETLRQELGQEPIVAVNGCIYGFDRQPLKRDDDPDKVYYKYAGQHFWEFISGNPTLYRDIILPIDQQAKQKDSTFKTAYAAKINEITQDFISDFVTDNLIDWAKLIDFVSQRRT